MQKVNTRDIHELEWGSPGGKYRASGRQISEALGREPKSTDILLRHPFDIEIQRIAPGCTPNIYHSHSMQWEFYHVISGTGTIRHEGGVTAIEPGDAFIFKPGEAHQLSNTGTEDLLVYVVADNPVGESTYYPDSDKYVIHSPQRKVIRSQNLDYFDGEE